MSKADAEVRLARIKSHVDQLHAARDAFDAATLPFREERGAADDKSTMDVAGDLLALFKASHIWKIVPSQKAKKKPGRPVEPGSKEQFYKYVGTNTKLSASWTKRLLAAAEFLESFRDLVPETLPTDSERVLRPLVAVGTDATADDMTAVFDWVQQYAEADGGVITAKHTRDAAKELRATPDWKNRHKTPKRAKVIGARIMALLDDLENETDGRTAVISDLRKRLNPTQAGV